MRSLPGTALHACEGNVQIMTVSSAWNRGGSAGPQGRLPSGHPHLCVPVRSTSNAYLRLRPFPETRTKASPWEPRGIPALPPPGLCLQADANDSLEGSPVWETLFSFDPPHNAVRWESDAVTYFIGGKTEAPERLRDRYSAQGSRVAGLSLVPFIFFNAL